MPGTSLHQLLTALGQSPRVALILLADVQGSSPREAGAYMLVTASSTINTIGGGTLEHQAIQDARAALTASSTASLPDNSPQVTVTSHALGPALGQCCGGRVSIVRAVFTQDHVPMVQALVAHVATTTNPVLVWPMQPATTMHIRSHTDIRHAKKAAERPSLSAGTCSLDQTSDQPILYWHMSPGHTPVMLFGAGHVGQALIHALSPLPFDITWIDSRPEQFPPNIPPHINVLPSMAPAEEVTAAVCRDHWLLVLTHSHQLDQDICRRALSLGPPAYLGLIGSKTKKATFLSRLRTEGLCDQRLTHLTCPIGLPGITDKRPTAIAAAVAADLMIRREAACENGLTHQDISTPSAMTTEKGAPL